MLQITQSRVFIPRLLTENALLFFLQYCGLMFAVFTEKPLPFCLATGTSCAFIFMRGYYIIPGVFLGTVVAFNVTFHSFSGALIWGFAYSFQAVMLFWLMQRMVYPTLLFYKISTLIKFVLLSLLITGITSYFLVYPFPDKNLFWIIWLAHLNGILIFSTGLIKLDAYFPVMNAKNFWKPSIIYFIAIGFIVAIQANSFFSTWANAHQVQIAMIFFMMSLINIGVLNKEK